MAVRVLHAIGTSDTGGTERFLTDLVSRHRAMDVESAICVLDSPGALAKEYQAVASRVGHLNLRSNVWRAVAQWRAHLRAFRPHVVVLYGSRANALGRTFRGGPDRPAVITALRSTRVDEHGRRGASWLDRLTFRRVQACVSNSRSALDRLLATGYPAQRLAYIRPGVDASRFRSIDRATARQRLGLIDDTPVLLCVANLKRVKNHALLIRTSAKLLAQGMNHRLWLVGDGPERAPLEALVRELRLDDVVVFAGHEDNPAPRYIAADAFVLASRWEGTPTALLDAMAAGLPAAAPPVGDVADLLLDNVTGKIVPPDDAQALAAAVMELLDPLRHSLFARAAGARAALFDADVAAARYAELFRWTTIGRPEPMPFRYHPSPAAGIDPG